MDKLDGSCVSVISIQQDCWSELNFVQLLRCGHAHSTHRNSVSVCLEVEMSHRLLPLCSNLFITHIRSVSIHPLLQRSVEHFHWMGSETVTLPKCQFSCPILWFSCPLKASRCRTPSRCLFLSRHFPILRVVLTSQIFYSL